MNDTITFSSQTCFINLPYLFISQLHWEYDTFYKMMYGRVTANLLSERECDLISKLTILGI